MELNILDYLVSHGGSAPYGDILNAFPTFLDTKGVLLLLKKGGYIDGPLTSSSSVSITVLGRGYLSKLQERKNQQQCVEDQHDKQHRTDVWLAALAAIFSGLSLLLTVFQHFGLF